MLEQAEKTGEPHSRASVTPSTLGRELAFLIAVDLIARNPVSRETPGVAPDRLLDILVMTARRFRDRELTRPRR